MPQTLIPPIDIASQNQHHSLIQPPPLQCISHHLAVPNLLTSLWACARTRPIHPVLPLLQRQEARDAFQSRQAFAQVFQRRAPSAIGELTEARKVKFFEGANWSVNWSASERNGNTFLHQEIKTRWNPAAFTIRFWWQNRLLGPGNTVVLVTSLGGTQPTLPCALAGQVYEEFVLEKGSEIYWKRTC